MTITIVRQPSTITITRSGGVTVTQGNTIAVTQAITVVTVQQGRTAIVISNTGTQGPEGAMGPAGATGAAGPGVPAGGTTGQVLKKIDGTDYNTEWGIGNAVDLVAVTYFGGL